MSVQITSIEEVVGKAVTSALDEQPENVNLTLNIYYAAGSRATINLHKPWWRRMIDWWKS